MEEVQVDITLDGCELLVQRFFIDDASEVVTAFII